MSCILKHQLSFIIFSASSRLGKYSLLPWSKPPWGNWQQRRGWGNEVDWVRAEASGVLSALLFPTPESHCTFQPSLRSYTEALLVLKRWWGKWKISASQSLIPLIKLTTNCLRSAISRIHIIAMCVLKHWNGGHRHKLFQWNKKQWNIQIKSQSHHGPISAFITHSVSSLYTVAILDTRHCLISRWPY